MKYFLPATPIKLKIDFRDVTTLRVLFIMALLLSASCSRKPQTKPILVLATMDNFGLYIAEILRTEGFNGFAMDTAAGWRADAGYLAGYDVVVLAQMATSTAQEQALEEYVRQGGNLIAFRPSGRLDHVFGIRSGSEAGAFGYMSVVDDEGTGKGLTREKLRINSGAVAFELSGAREIARLHTGTGQPAGIPAVVFHQYEKGSTVAFSYNLPESIVITRQGNPASAGLEKDGILGIRAMDLFTHGFVDTTQNTLNPADEQMRLVSHAIEQMTLRTKPLPRFWYFPDSLKCVVTLNNDGEDSHENEFLEQFEDVAKRGASMTLYVKEPQLISPGRVATWLEDGFEISGHPDDTRQATRPDWQTMDSVYTVLGSRLKALYGIEQMRTVTNHWFVWVGNNADGAQNFAAQAEIEALHGIGLDCNYAHYDNGSDQGHFLGTMGYRQGNYTGTGLTMKFANSDGRIIDIYQQLNNVYDQQYMEHQDQDGYFNAFRGLMDRSLRDEVYSSISVRAHNNEYFFSKVPLMKILDYANARHIPVWSELTWLEFLQAKDEASFENIRWDNNRLSFSVRSAKAFERDLSCIIPFDYNGMTVREISQNSSSCNFEVVEIKGVHYSRIAIKPGHDHEVVVHYSGKE